MADESTGLNTLWGDIPVQAVVASIGATTADTVVVWTNNTGRQVKITAAGYIADTDVTGADTNNMALQFQNRGTLGTGTTGITDVKTYDSGTDLVDFVEDALTLSTTAADLLVDIDETVALDKTENGTGAALPAGVATLKFQFVG